MSSKHLSLVPLVPLVFLVPLVQESNRTAIYPWLDEIPQFSSGYHTALV
jgi:hypothetical protein